MLWILVVLAGVAAVGLTAFAAVADMETADRIASVTGAVVSAIALGVSLVVLLRQSGGETGGGRVRAGQGGVAAGRDIVGTAIGARSTVEGAVSAPAAGGAAAADVETGPGGVASGRDIRDTAIGDDSTRR